MVRAYELRPDVRGSGVPQQHLPGARGVFQHRDTRSRWSQHNQLPMQGGISGKYQMDWARVDTGGRTQRYPANRGGGASNLGKSPLHAQRCAGSAAAMVWAVEEAAAARHRPT